MNFEPPGKVHLWNPTNIDDVIRAIGNQLKPVKELFNDELEDGPLKFIEMYDNYKKAFDIISNRYPPITIPINTLIFHTNKFFGTDINMYEPLGTRMKIQDIRRYVNKGARKDNDLYYPMSETSSRIYCNFTPAANQYVVGNLNVSESAYITAENLTFFQLPVHNGWHLKDLLQLTSTVLFRKYIEEKNNNPEKTKYCGFILSTTVDSALLLDRDTLYFSHTDTSTGKTEYVYPEILLMDGFSKLIKVGQYDIYEYGALGSGINMYDALASIDMDFYIKRIDINTQLKEIYETFSVEKTNIGNYGAFPLTVYKANKTDTFWTRDYDEPDL